MRIKNLQITFQTKGEGDIVDLTPKVMDVVSRSGMRNGLVHLFAPHATGSIILTEYEASLSEDVRRLLETLVPRRGGYNHPVNAHSHLRSILLGPSKTLPLVDGRLVLGTWQSVVWVEVDTRSRSRRIMVQIVGD